MKIQLICPKDPVMHVHPHIHKTIIQINKYPLLLGMSIHVPLGSTFTHSSGFYFKVRSHVYDSCLLNPILPCRYTPLPGGLSWVPQSGLGQDVQMAWGCSVLRWLAWVGTSPHVDVFWLPSPACSNIVPRSAWEARKTHCPKMNLPAKYVVIFHTAGRTCIMSDECHLLVQDIQSFFIDRLNSCDIGYK